MRRTSSTTAVVSARTGDVRDDASRCESVHSRREQADLQRHELGDVCRGLAPSGLRAPTEGAEAGAGRVHEDPIERVRPLGRQLPAVPLVHGDLARNGAQGVAHEPGAGGHHLVGFQDGVVLPGDGSEQGGLPAGARAEIEPPLPCAQRRRRGQRERDELRPLVLHPDRAVGGGQREARIASRRRESRGGVGPARLLGLCQTGKGDERDLGRDVVGLQQGVQFLDPPLSGEGAP